MQWLVLYRALSVGKIKRFSGETIYWWFYLWAIFFKNNGLFKYLLINENKIVEICLN